MNRNKLYISSLLAALFLLFPALHIGTAFSMQTNPILKDSFTDEELRKLGDGSLSQDEYNAFVKKVNTLYAGNSTVRNFAIFKSFKNYQDDSATQQDLKRSHVAQKIKEGQDAYIQRIQHTPAANNRTWGQWVGQNLGGFFRDTVTSAQSSSGNTLNPMEMFQNAFSEDLHNQRVTAQIQQKIIQELNNQLTQLHSTSSSFSPTTIDTLTRQIIDNTLKEFSTHWQLGISDPTSNELRNALLLGITLTLKQYENSFNQTNQISSVLEKLQNDLVKSIKITCQKYQRGIGLQILDTLSDTIQNKLGSQLGSFNEQLGNASPDQKTAQDLENALLKIIYQKRSNTIDGLLNDLRKEFYKQNYVWTHEETRQKIAQELLETIDKNRAALINTLTNDLNTDQLQKMTQNVFTKYKSGQLFQIIDTIRTTLKNELGNETDNLQDLWSNDKTQHKAAQKLEKLMLKVIDTVCAGATKCDATFLDALSVECLQKLTDEIRRQIDTNAPNHQDKPSITLQTNIEKNITQTLALFNTDRNQDTPLTPDEMADLKARLHTTISETFLPFTGGKGHQVIVKAKQILGSQFSSIEQEIKNKITGQTTELENLWASDKPEHLAAQVIQKNLLEKIDTMTANTDIKNMVDTVFTAEIINTLNAHDSHLTETSTADTLKAELQNAISQTLQLNTLNGENNEAKKMVAATIKRTMLPHIGGKAVQVATNFEQKITDKVTTVKEQMRRELLTSLDINPDGETPIFTAIENKMYGLAVKWGATGVSLIVAVPVLSFLGYFSSKYGIQYIYERLSNPEPLLFTESSERGFTARWADYILRRKDKVADLIYDQELEQRFDRITRSTINAFRDIQDGKANIFYEPVLMHGPPGTGKTAQAKRMIKQIYNETGGKMQWRITNGSMLLNAGIDGINTMFAWLNKQQAACLFIDEADTLFPDRDELAKSPERLEVVNHLLNLIGERSNKFMIVMTTNRLGAFDEAMERRIDNLIYVGLPKEQGRKMVLELYRDTMLLSKKRHPERWVTLWSKWVVRKVQENYNKFVRKQDTQTPQSAPVISEVK